MPDKLEENKAIMRRMLEAFNTGDTSVVKELLGSKIKDRSQALGLEPTIRNSPVVRRVQTEIMREKQAFPDQKFTEVSLVAEGDRVVLHWQMTGTHRGDFIGHAGTGKKVKTFGTEFVRISRGKIVEHDDDPFHILDLLWQLDLLTPEVLRQKEFR